MPNKVLFSTQVTDTSTADVESVGCLRQFQNAIYVWVKNNDTVALAAGSLAYEKLADGVNAENYVYSLANAGAGAILRGVVTSTSIAAGAYGWVVVLSNSATALLFNSGATGTLPAGAYVVGTATTTGGLAVGVQGNLPLTDSSGGVAGLVIGAVTATIAYGIVNNNMASLAAAINALAGRSVISLSSLASTVMVATPTMCIVRCL